MERDDSQIMLDSNQHHAKWYCRIGNAEYGPLSYTLLRQLVNDGKLAFSPKDLVRFGPDGRWMTIDSVISLHALYRDNQSSDQFVVSAQMEQASKAVQSRREILGPISRAIDCMLLPITGVTEYVIDRLSDLHGLTERVKSIIEMALPEIMRYATQIAAMSTLILWCSANYIIMYHPQLWHILVWHATRLVQSPAMWFGSIALGAFAGALYVRARA